MSCNRPCCCEEKKEKKPTCPCKDDGREEYCKCFCKCMSQKGPRTDSAEYSDED